jgi:hypothetical protein
VRTDGATVIKQELERIGVGATVEAKGVDDGGGVVLATVIEVKQGVPGASPPVAGGDDRGEFTGAIESMPPAGLVGSWRIAGCTVVVVAATRLQQELGGFRVGAIVEGHGLVDGVCAVTASAIEVKSGGAGAPVPPGAGAELEIVGTIGALPRPEPAASPGRRQAAPAGRVGRLATARRREPVGGRLWRPAFPLHCPTTGMEPICPGQIRISSLPLEQRPDSSRQYGGTVRSAAGDWDFHPTRPRCGLSMEICR